MRRHTPNRDSTPQDLVGCIGTLGSGDRRKSWRVLSPYVSRARLWARVISLSGDFVGIREMTSSTGPVLTRSEAARRLRFSNGFLCALAPIDDSEV